jgi:ArpU family phage transcriptional regulator
MEPTMINTRKLDTQQKQSISQAIQILEKYRDCLLRTDDDYLPSGVSTYSREAKHTSNEFYSLVENAMIKKDEDLQFINRVLKAFNRMPMGEEKYIIEMKYIRRHKLTDTQIRNKHFWGRTTLYYKEKKALYDFSHCIKEKS